MVHLFRLPELTTASRAREQEGPRPAAGGCAAWDMHGGNGQGAGRAPVPEPHLLVAALQPEGGRRTRVGVKSAIWPRGTFCKHLSPTVSAQT